MKKQYIVTILDAWGNRTSTTLVKAENEEAAKAKFQLDVCDFIIAVQEVKEV